MAQKSPRMSMTAPSTTQHRENACSRLWDKARKAVEPPVTMRKAPMKIAPWCREGILLRDRKCNQIRLKRQAVIGSVTQAHGLHNSTVCVFPMCTVTTHPDHLHFQKYAHNKIYKHYLYIIYFLHDFHVPYWWKKADHCPCVTPYTLSISWSCVKVMNVWFLGK